VKKVMAAFCFGEIARKKVTTMSRGLLMWFHCSKEGDDSFHHLLQWLCYNKMAACAFLWFCCEGDNNNVITFLYGDGVVEKAMARGDFFLFFFWVVLLV